MKMTVWQQFSSNHSNGFTVVGVFEDEAQAKKTYARLRKLIKDIDDWYEENELDKYESYSASEPEKAIGKEFRFDWEEKTADAPTDFDLNAISLYKNIVQVSSSADSWTRRKPYELLLKKMGGKAAGYDSAEQDDDAAPTNFRIKITGTLPTKEDAATFMKKWQEKVEERAGVITQKGAVISISKVWFEIDLFADLVKALEKMGSTNVEYKLTKAAMDADYI